jgi:cell division topological specificity factor
MRLFRFLKPISSAPVARERLQILLEYERRMVSQSSLITTLKDEILAVVSRHVSIDPEKIHVSVDRGNGFSTLAVGVQIPNQVASETGMLQAGDAGQSPATPS